MTDDHRDGCQCHGCVCSRYELEIHSLTNDIEYEREENARLQMHLQRGKEQEAHLNAENARLRAALQEIADEIKAKHPVTIARQALKGQQ